MRKTSFLKYFLLLSRAWNCFYTMQICRALSRQILRSFVLFCCSCFFGRENLNYVTFRDNKSVLASHRKSEFIPDHELRNLDKGWRLILYVFCFSSLVKGDTLSSFGKTMIFPVPSFWPVCFFEFLPIYCPSFPLGLVEMHYSLIDFNSIFH